MPSIRLAMLKSKTRSGLLMSREGCENRSAVFVLGEVGCGCCSSRSRAEVRSGMMLSSNALFKFWAKWGQTGNFGPLARSQRVGEKCWMEKASIMEKETRCYRIAAHIQST